VAYVPSTGSDKTSSQVSQVTLNNNNNNTNNVIYTAQIRQGSKLASSRQF